MGDLGDIRIFQTAEHRCGYFPERQARDIVFDPHDPRLPANYGAALALGFRRSGGHVYRPHCNGCRACVPVRVPVASFLPDRGQRRCLERNGDLSLVEAPAERTAENFALYRKYLAARHPDGGMDNPAPEDFDRFLACDWSPTRFLEFRRDGRLLAVAVTDQAPDGLSSVYTFFDPEQASRGLGSYAILRQIALTRDLGRDYLYLGYWIENHPKMDYKRRFRPLQYQLAGHWQPLPKQAQSP